MSFRRIEPLHREPVLTNAQAVILNDAWPHAPRRNNRYVRAASDKGSPRQDVAGLEGSVEIHAQGIALLPPETGALAVPVDFQIGHPAVIDVGVGVIQPPVPRIGREGASHIFVHQTLQINAPRVTGGANDNIRAHTDADRNVAVRIADRPISRIITLGNADLTSRCPNQFGRATARAPRW